MDCHPVCPTAEYSKAPNICTEVDVGLSMYGVIYIVIYFNMSVVYPLGRLWKVRDNAIRTCLNQRTRWTL